MKIVDIINSPGIHVSYEFFPPKLDAPFDSVMQATHEVAQLSPAFCSITYGASGGATHHTVQVASYVKNQLGLPALAHMTGASLSRAEAREVLAQLKGHNIENILALRGDAHLATPELRKWDFAHASDLIHFIKKEGDFCVGAACYPEGHVESEDKRDDLLYLKLKQDMGADFLTSQMFFDNNIFYNFMYRLRDAGVHIPVVAGIMPIATYGQIKKISRLSGGNFPAPFIAIADRFKYHPEAFETAMINYTCQQITDLIANGVRNIHIYTMNKGATARRIVETLGPILSA